MKGRELYRIIATTFTAAYWSFMAVVIVFVPMVLLGMPRRVAITVAIGATVLSASLTAYGAICLHRERSRRSVGCCVRCGQDLKGNTDRCPNCKKLIGRRDASA